MRGPFGPGARLSDAPTDSEERESYSRESRPQIGHDAGERLVHKRRLSVDEERDEPGYDSPHLSVVRMRWKYRR